MFKAISVMLLTFLSGAFGGNPGDAFDIRKNQYIPEGIRWMEVGFFYIYQNRWVQVEATYRNFTDPLVFLSLPNLAGETSNDGYAMSLRVKNAQLQYLSPTHKNYSFQAKSYGANDTPYCSDWATYTPSKLTLAPSYVSWLVVERGFFNLSHHAFNINWDKINRTNEDEVGDDRNRIRSFAMTGCVSSTAACGWSPGFDAANLVSIAQLQTTNFNRFMLLRGFRVFKSSVTYILTPQDSNNVQNYYIPNPGEVYGFIIFEQGLRVACVENLVIETYKYSVNYIKQSLSYANTFLIPPGVYGMVNTLLGRDSLGLRAFNLGVTSADFITQEDQCIDPETTHTNFETAAVLVIGQIATVGSTVCGAIFNDNQPTTAPTHAPTVGGDWCVDLTLYDTFGDGWGPNVALKVWSDLTDPVFIYYSCPENDPHQFCFSNADEAHFDIVVIDPPATETWEIYWTLDWIRPDYPHQLFLGDFDTNMTATSESIDIWDPVDYQNQSCHRCNHPPKVPPKDKKGPSADSKGSNSEKSSSDGSTGEESADSSSSHADTHDSDGHSTGGHGSDGHGSEGHGSHGHSKPKPLFPFPFRIFDTTGSGWFNGSEAWTDVPAYSCDGSFKFVEDRSLPTVITNPEYIISTIDRVHDIRRGTICGDLLADDCEERLPDGKYIFRVTGALSRYDTFNNTKWHFCGKHGTSMEELEFKLIKGKCFAGKLLSASGMCCGTTFASFSGMLSLDNVASEFLSEFDTALLESDLAESMSSVISRLHGSVSLNSWTVSGSTILIPFSLKIVPSDFGVNGLSESRMTELASSLLSSAQSFASSGAFVTYLQKGIMDLPLSSNDALSGVTSASVISLTYVDSSIASVVNDAPVVSVGDSVNSQSIASQLQAFQKSVGYVFGSIALVAVIVGVVFGARYQSKTAYDEISQDSVRNTREILTEEVSRGAGIRATGSVFVAETHRDEELPSERTPNFF